MHKYNLNEYNHSDPDNLSFSFIDLYIPILWSGVAGVLSVFVIYDKSDTMCKMRINWKIENGTDMHGYLKEYFTGFRQLFSLLLLFSSE